MLTEDIFHGKLFQANQNSMLGLDSSLLSVSTGYHTRASLLPPEPHNEISLGGEQTCSAGCRIRAWARYPETNRGIFTRCTHTLHLRGCICICSHSHSHSPKDQASQINRDYKNNAAFEILDEKRWYCTTGKHRNAPLSYRKHSEGERTRKI